MPQTYCTTVSVCIKNKFMNCSAFSRHIFLEVLFPKAPIHVHPESLLLGFPSTLKSQTTTDSWPQFWKTIFCCFQNILCSSRHPFLSHKAPISSSTHRFCISQGGTHLFIKAMLAYPTTQKKPRKKLIVTRNLVRIFYAGRTFNSVPTSKIRYYPPGCDFKTATRKIPEWVTNLS